MGGGEDVRRSLLRLPPPGDGAFPRSSGIYLSYLRFRARNAQIISPCSPRQLFPRLTPVSRSLFSPLLSVADAFAARSFARSLVYLHSRERGECHFRASFFLRAPRREARFYKSSTMRSRVASHYGTCALPFTTEQRPTLASCLFATRREAANRQRVVAAGN